MLSIKNFDTHLYSFSELSEIDVDTHVTNYKVTMVTWTADDRYVLTAVNDLTVKVWDSYNGHLIHVLKVSAKQQFYCK